MGPGPSLNPVPASRTIESVMLHNPLGVPGNEGKATDDLVHRQRRISNVPTNLCERIRAKRYRRHLMLAAEPRTSQDAVWVLLSPVPLALHNLRDTLAKPRDHLRFEPRIPAQPPIIARTRMGHRHGSWPVTAPVPHSRGHGWARIGQVPPLRVLPNDDRAFDRGKAVRVGAAMQGRTRGEAEDHQRHLCPDSRSPSAGSRPGVGRRTQLGSVQATT